jgi:hypothetical protein
MVSSCLEQATCIVSAQSDEKACLQCPTGWFSGSAATACTSCSAGKYVTNSSGGTEAAACTNVSRMCYVMFGLQQADVLLLLCTQCPSGAFSASAATACSACSAGKYVTNAAGRTEAGSCTAVGSCLEQAMCQVRTKLTSWGACSARPDGSQAVLRLLAHRAVRASIFRMPVEGRRPPRAQA